MSWTAGTDGDTHMQEEQETFTPEAAPEPAPAPEPEPEPIKLPAEVAQALPPAPTKDDSEEFVPIPEGFMAALWSGPAHFLKSSCDGVDYTLQQGVPAVVPTVLYERLKAHPLYWDFISPANS